MKANILDAAMTLSDKELLDRIATLAGTERQTTAELVAHLAVLELRPNLYLAQGYDSLYRYCTGALRLSEDAACSRIKVTRTCRDYPVILDPLAAGTVSLTTVRMLAPHLTAANHEAVLARATNRSREEIEALVAELAPQPDVVPSVRKLPSPNEVRRSSVATTLPLVAFESVRIAAGVHGPAVDQGEPDGAASALNQESALPRAHSLPNDHQDAGPMRPAHARPIVRASAPDRYRVQFTIDRNAYDELRKVQALLRREIPSGDPGVIFARALHLLRQKVEKAKFASKAVRPSAQAAPSVPPQSAPPPAGPNDEMGIRPRTDGEARNSISGKTRSGMDCERRPPSRHIPNAVKRAVWWRDGGQCAFLSADGRRCTALSYLELHHLRPYALDGPATAGNIALRCRRHNQYESELIFGPYDASRVRKVDERRYGSA